MAEFQPVIEERPGGLSRLLFFPLFLLAALSVGTAIAREGIDISVPVLLILLSALYVTIARRAARTDPLGPVLFQMLVLAWLAKLAAMGFKYYLLFAVYSGATDATGYHRSGIEISALLASGRLPLMEQFWGTEFIELVSGILYLFIGPSFLGGWLVWSFLGSIGMLWHYKAFVTALPAAHRRLYMYLILFAPSILMWTNTLGKDAWVAFFLGMTIYGAAQAARRGLNLPALLYMGFGLAGVFLARPHTGGLVAVGLSAIVLLQPIRLGILSPVIRIATLALFAALAVFVVRTSASFINLEDLSVEGVTGFLENEQEQSAEGGSVFTGTLPTTPQGYAVATATVLFRPFPWEANGILAQATSLEGVTLMFLLLWRLRSVLAAIWAARRNAYLGFTVIYVPLFIFFFSAISNFGILVRQRVQLLPFLFVWLAFRGPKTNDENGTST